jgi:hypothetical protein
LARKYVQVQKGGIWILWCFSLAVWNHSLISQCGYSSSLVRQIYTLSIACLLLKALAFVSCATARQEPRLEHQQTVTLQGVPHTFLQRERWAKPETKRSIHAIVPLFLWKGEKEAATLSKRERLLSHPRKNLMYQERSKEQCQERWDGVPEESLLATRRQICRGGVLKNRGEMMVGGFQETRCEMMVGGFQETRCERMIGGFQETRCEKVFPEILAIGAQSIPRVTDKRVVLEIRPVGYCAVWR